MAVVLVVLTGPVAAHGATFVVATTADTGLGSLRQAILDANAAPGSDTIWFAIPTVGVPSIVLATPLPTVTDPVTIDGTTQLPAGWVELSGQAIISAIGLTLAAGGSTVRGLVINGFDQAGILLSGPGNNLVEGNRIGTDVSGTQAQSPFAYGIEVSGSPANHIGGTAPGSGNLLSGNLFGIFIHGSAAVGNVIEGNLIGTDASGTAALENVAIGIWIFGASATIIGGADPAAGNVIAGNGSDGVDVGGASVLDTAIAGNAIGFAADHATPLGNGNSGVYIYGGAAGTSIGGLAANWIGANGDAGVKLETTAGTGNAIRGNVIRDNVGLGIDLGVAGVTANDPGDVDTGPNGLQNFPVLDPAFTGGTQVLGTLDSAADASFVVELFATATCDETGHGEGAELLAVQDVTTDGTGHGEFTAALSRNVDASIEYVTATATDAMGNTSEFSACTPATLLPTTTTSTTTSSTVFATTTTSTTVTTTTVLATTTTSTTVTTTTAPSTTSSTTATSSTTSTTAEQTTSTSTTLDPATTSTTSTSTSTTSTTAVATTSTTTTLVASTTSTTSTTIAGATSTTTTLSGASTTSTTLGGPCSGSGCPCRVEASFDSIHCRLDVMVAALPQMSDLGADRERLGRQLDRGRLLLGAAEARCEAAKLGPARAKLRKVGRRLRRVLRLLRVRYGHRVPPLVEVEQLTGTTTQLANDTRTLARGLACP